MANLKLPNDTSPAAIQRHLKRIEDWAKTVGGLSDAERAEINASITSIQTDITNINASVADLEHRLDNLALDDLTDVDTTGASVGDVLTLGASKWEDDSPGAATPQIQVGSGPPSGVAATTLAWYDQTGKIFYLRNDTTVGPGASWGTLITDGLYTEP